MGCYCKGGSIQTQSFIGFTSPLSLVDMLHVTGGGFSSQWFPFLLVACLIWATCLPRLGSLPLVSFSLHFFSSFLFIKFGRVSPDYTFNEGDALDLFSKFDYISLLADKSIPVIKVLLVVIFLDLPGRLQLYFN